jgi:hypothetical protein
MWLQGSEEISRIFFLSKFYNLLPLQNSYKVGWFFPFISLIYQLEEWRYVFSDID